jgi:hypothetical protein
MELRKLNSHEFNDPMKKWAKELNRDFSKEIVQMHKKYMKKCSTSLAIKKMKIKTTLRFFLTPVRMATIKNANDNKCWQGCVDKGPLTHCWWECKLVQSLWKTPWSLCKKLRIELLYDPTVPLL